jgi:hypothetical protein
VENSHYKFDSRMQVSPDMYRKAVLLGVLCNIFLALLLLPAYLCIVAFFG